MAQNETIGYKDVNPFSHHIIWLLEEGARTKWKYNDIIPNGSDPLTQQLIHLEDWYMNLESLYHSVIGKLEEEEIKRMDEMQKVIEDITKGDNFSTKGLSTEQIVCIRSNCRKISRELQILLWKHRIHVDVRSKVDKNKIWL